MPAPEAMLAQQHFVRALVHSLLRGADGEDDVVQQTWLRGLRGAPRDSNRWRPWLARVAKNLALDHLRDARRRGARESAAATPEALPSTADVLQREEERQRVVLAVLGLPQPYRNVVLLRYWEELAPASIAARLDVPGATVRSQLRRGLALLRERLDGDYGDRRGWTVALSPFVTAGETIGPSGATASAMGAMGAMVISTKAKAVFAACGVIVAGLLTWWAVRPPLGSAPLEQPAAPPAPMIADAGAEPAAENVPPLSEERSRGREAVADSAVLTVSGRVRHSGRPYPGLSFELQWFDGFDAAGEVIAAHEVTSDALGEFEWRGLVRQVTGTLRGSSDSNRVKLFGTPVVVSPGDRSVTLDIDVFPLDCLLRGVVRNRAGEPIENASLDVNGWKSTTSGAGGRFELFVPRGGDSRPVDVHAPGYQQKLVETDIPADATTYEIEIELGPGARFAGRVVDQGGSPVAGATVRASGLFHSVETDVSGRFVLDSAGPGESHEISASMVGFSRSAKLSEAGNEKIELVLEPGLAQGVRVLDSEGRGVIGAMIRTVARIGASWRRRGFTDHDGRLLLQDLELGELVVIVDKSGFVRARQAVDVGDAQGELVFRLEKAHTVRGRVVDATGQPIAGASIYGQLTTASGGEQQVGERVDSGPDGYFELPGLPQEPCTILAHHRDYARASAESIVAGAGELVLRLERAPSVAGRVLDGATGRPIDVFTVRIAADPEVQQLRMDPKSFKDTDGYWEVSNWKMVSGAELHLHVSARGYAPTLTTSVAQPDSPRDQSVILLYPGVVVSGTVRHATTGAPIAGVNVRLRGGGDTGDPTQWFRGAAATTLTDDTGGFSLGSVPTGAHRLELTRQGLPPATFGPFEVGRGPGELEVHPTMAAGVALRGRVVGFDNATGWTVVVRSRRTHLRVRTEVRPDLTFAIEGLAPGSYAVSVRDPSSYERSFAVEVGEVDVDGFEINGREGPGSIRAEVRGVPRGYAQVEPVSEAPRSERPASHLFPFEGGGFRVQGLAPGKYRVSVFVPNDPDQTVMEVDVGRGERSVVIDAEKNV